MEQSVLLLLVEDEPLIGLALQDALEEAGFAVHHALAAEEAIQALDTKHAGISGVITDIKFGGGLDGWAIARHARELLPHVPVVYMSGDSAPDHTVHGVPDSVMLQKPFVPAQLVTAISTLLNAVPIGQTAEPVTVILLEPKSPDNAGPDLEPGDGKLQR